jgi:hypothetical protein
LLHEASGDEKGEKTMKTIKNRKNTTVKNRTQTGKSAVAGGSLLLTCA